MRSLVVAVLVPVVLGGCANTLTGFDGGSQFACKAPDGVTCSSLSGVYANAVANNLPGLRKSEKGAAKDAPTPSAGEIVGKAPSSGNPIRTQPKTLRVWIAPWEDTDGDLHDQSYVYVLTDPGRWVIEHNQKRIVDRYRPTFLQAGTANVPQKPAAPAGQNPGGVMLPGAQMVGQANAQASSLGGGNE
jgi:conjugal transfer pilus assembly protein TraV